jgi:parallel beta-helix repeat protein
MRLINLECKMQIFRYLLYASVLFSFICMNPELVLSEEFTGQTFGDGECVTYAKIKTGNSDSHSPGLGDDGPAYKIFEEWDYGFGKGEDPAENSLIVLDKWTGNPYGHVGIVRSVIPKENGLYELRVDESNWYDKDGLETKNVYYEFNPKTKKTKREWCRTSEKTWCDRDERTGVKNNDLGSTPYTVKGFVYTQPNNPPKEIPAGCQGPGCWTPQGVVCEEAEAWYKATGIPTIGYYAIATITGKNICSDISDVTTTIDESYDPSDEPPEDLPDDRWWHSFFNYFFNFFDVKTVKAFNDSSTTSSENKFSNFVEKRTIIIKSNGQMLIGSSTRNIKGHTITGNEIWYGGDEYVIHGNITVASGGSLTIEPGTTVKMTSGTTISVSGKLIAKDATFTWADGENEWKGISFLRNSSESKLENCTIEYTSGAGGHTNYLSSVFIASSSPTITGCTMNNSTALNGITTLNSESSPVITGNTINGYSGQGIYVDSYSSPTITGNTLNNSGKGIVLHYGGSNKNNPLISDNSYDGNSSGNCYVNGTIDTAITWTEPTYRIGSLTIGNEGSLNITAGEQKIEVDGDVTISVSGKLIAKDATFTWADGENEWKGISFLRNSSESKLENCTIEYTSGAGGHTNYLSSVFIASSSPTITGCTMNNSTALNGITTLNSESSPVITGNTINGYSGQGIYVDSYSSPTITGNTLSNNLHGLYIAGNNTGTFQGNHFSGNTSHGIYYTGTPIDAAYSSWGDATGPYDPSDDRNEGGWFNPTGLGDLVSDHVNYQPWAQYAGQVRIVDNRDINTSHVGDWEKEAGIAPFGQDAAVISQNGGIFTFTADNIQGDTAFSLWWPEHPQGNPAATVEIYDDATLLDTISVNQQEKSGQWNDLGIFGFNGTAVVVVKSDTDSFTTLADAVKFMSLSESEYTVTITSTEGGKTDKTGERTIVYGGSITITAIPEQGYAFAGWSGDMSGMDNPLTVDNIVSDITVTAQFESESYTVVFKDFNGSELKNETVVYGASATAPDDPIRYGYAFTGWDVAFDTITDDLTVTAQYAILTFTVTYLAADNGTITGQTSQTINHGGNTTEVVAVPDIGYYFDQWSDGSTALLRTDTNVTSNMTVTAEFSIKVHTVTFLDHDGTILKSQTVNHGTGATPPPDPEREEYTFKGWDEAFDTITADLTVTAQYVKKTYQVTYSAGDNGTITGPTQQIVTHGYNSEPVTAEPDTGYHFAKWSDGVTANPRTDENVISDISVTAVFDYIKGDVNLDGKINMKDAILLIQYSANLTDLTDEQKKRGNISGHEDDNQVGMADAFKIIGFMAEEK